jgi:hypothetical protein
MICITKPLLPNGLTDYNQTTDFAPGTYIDGAIISRNFQEIYRTVNGNLHAKNFGGTNNPTKAWKDKYIQFPEYHYDTIPVVGMGHSHNGLDSSPLGWSCVNMTTTQHRSFGAWMMPSARVTGLVLHGSAQVTSLGGIWDPTTGSSLQTLLIDIPYDTYRFPNYSMDVTNARTRCFLQARCSDPDVGSMITCVFGKVLRFTGGDNSQAPYIRAYIRYNKNFNTSGSGNYAASGMLSAPPTETSGLWIDWMVTFMVYRTGLG